LVTWTQVKTLYKQQTSHIQSAADITPTFQRGITNKWYEVSPKTFYFPNVDITKFFTLGFQNYIVQMVAMTADTHLEPFFFSWSKDRGRCLKTLALKYPHRKKSQGLKSGEHGGHRTASCKETTRPGNIFKIARGRHAVWVVAPSRWNQKSSRLCSSPYSSIFGGRKFSNMSRYRLAFTVTVTPPSSKK
jgi:hypothetical protein